MNTKCKCGGTYGLFHGIMAGIRYESYKCDKCAEKIFTLGQAEDFFKAYEKIYPPKF